MSGRAQQLRLVEALLFAVAEPIDEEALARHLDEAADVPGLLRELAKAGSNHGTVRTHLQAWRAQNRL